MNFKEVYRDIESFGSITFYVMATVRSLVGFNWHFFAQLTITFVIIQLIIHLTKTKISTHLAQGAALFILINTLYKSTEFFIFSSLLLAALAYSHSKIRKHKTKEMFFGILLGLIVSLSTLFAL